MKKVFTFKRILLVLSAVLILSTISYFLLLSFAFSNWTDWEKCDEFITEDKRYAIVLKASYPPIPPSQVVRIKIICVDKVNNKEKEFDTFKFNFSLKDDNPWFKFMDINSNQSELIAYDFNGEKKFTFVWSDIFK